MEQKITLLNWKALESFWKETVLC